MASASRRISSRSRVTSPMMRMARPGPGKRVSPDHGLGQTQLLADPPHLVLEELAQRLHELHLHVLGQSADVVVRLDLGGHTGLAPGLDHVGIERSLDQEANAPQPLGLLLEDADELLPHAHALLLRVGHAVEPREKASLRLHVDERNVEVAAEGLDHLRRLVLAQQAVVDEDTRQLITDGLVHEQSSDGRVDATREPAENLLVADLRPDALDLLLDHRCRGPGGRRSCDLVEEVLQHLLPMRRVHHLGVELDAVEPSLDRLERRHRSRRRRSGDTRASRRRGHRVAMAHPARLVGRLAREEPALAHVELGLAELGHLGSLRRCLPAPAPATGLRSRCRAPEPLARRSPGSTRGAPSEKTDAGPPLSTSATGLRRRISSAPAACDDELRVDAALAHPPRDQLRVLAAQVEHEDGTLLRPLLYERKRDDLAHQPRR